MRPANYLDAQPRARHTVVEKDGVRLGVVNLQRQRLPAGRRARRSPRSTRVLDAARGEADHVLVDFHAEATSEKVAMGWHLDGRVAAVVGTHTHVPTADAPRAARRDRLHHRRRHDRRARRA